MKKTTFRHSSRVYVFAGFEYMYADPNTSAFRSRASEKHQEFSLYIQADQMHHVEHYL